MKTTKLKLHRDAIRTLTVLQLSAVDGRDGAKNTNLVECPLVNNVVATAAAGCPGG